jgi:hypothetical protein
MVFLAGDGRPVPDGDRRFSATNIGDAVAKRSTAANTASDIKRWRNERDAITEKHSVAELEIQTSRPQKPAIARQFSAWSWS